MQNWRQKKYKISEWGGGVGVGGGDRDIKSWYDIKS